MFVRIVAVIGTRILFNPFGKTKAAKRKIPLTATALAVLKRLLKEAKGEVSLSASQGQRQADVEGKQRPHYGLKEFEGEGVQAL
jgi:hypothetical protein